MFYKLVIYEMHILHDRCLQFTFDLDKGYFPPERAYITTSQTLNISTSSRLKSLWTENFFLQKKKNFPNLIYKFPHKEFFLLKILKKEI